MTVEEFLTQVDRQNAEELRRRVDFIVLRIALTSEPRWEIDRAIEELAAWVERVFPDKTRLFDAIYRRRFARVWEQTRQDAWDA